MCALPSCSLFVSQRKELARKCEQFEQVEAEARGLRDEVVQYQAEKANFKLFKADAERRVSSAPAPQCAVRCTDICCLCSTC